MSPSLRGVSSARPYMEQLDAYTNDFTPFCLAIRARSTAALKLMSMVTSSKRKLSGSLEMAARFTTASTP
ncbi:hypothetical protein D9M68_954770 [compost metagenome]